MKISYQEFIHKKRKETKIMELFNFDDSFVAKVGKKDKLTDLKPMPTNPIPPKQKF